MNELTPCSQEKQPMPGATYQMPMSPSYQNMPYGFQENYTEVNRLVSSAMSLITLITQIRHTVEHPNVDALRAQVIEEIKSFERKLASVDYPIRIIIAARYALCTAIDETVLSRPWGTQSVWVQGSLLSIFHKETWGGERFYIILEDMLRDVRKNIDFVELVYFLLSLGFEGKFYGDENRAAREEIRSRIFYHIRHARAKPERKLSPPVEEPILPKSQQINKNKIKKISVWTITLLVLLNIGFNLRLYSQAKPMIASLNQISNVSPVTTFSQLINRPIVVRRHNQNEEPFYE